MASFEETIEMLYLSEPEMPALSADDDERMAHRTDLGYTYTETEEDSISDKESGMKFIKKIY